MRGRPAGVIWSPGGGRKCLVCRAPWVARFDEAEVRRLGACVQTPRCRRRNVDHRDRSCCGLSGCLVSVGGERKGFPPAALRRRRAWWTLACALAAVLIQCGESV
ncbi:hypothetical protein NDU88_008248 [Pleurodeles waltl]|uniref:Uncharacterized protein n=1 Tax=Pleurodeles waltl TaxID=8319 RepID=A0AAV7RX42_PLEWA|nr:hypothetical protein NDU88_008248 [Pleurodeles waltl]